jgi:hypothetical protein
MTGHLSFIIVYINKYLKKKRKEKENGMNPGVAKGTQFLLPF